MLNQGVLPTLAHEPMWLLINSIMGSFLEPAIVVRAIIFVSGSVVAWLVLRSRPGHFDGFDAVHSRIVLLHPSCPLVRESHDQRTSWARDPHRVIRVTWGGIESRA